MYISLTRVGGSLGAVLYVQKQVHCYRIYASVTGSCTTLCTMIVNSASCSTLTICQILRGTILTTLVIYFSVSENIMCMLFTCLCLLCIGVICIDIVHASQVLFDSKSIEECVPCSLAYNFKGHHVKNFSPLLLGF